LVLTRLGDGAWSSGRAGMLYRDLVPDRQGGYLVASHIRIPQGGPVPDYVHYHRVRFQLIYCVAGSARVVYQDQGPPFELRPGDAVLQPPEIRHRVLECTPGLEVIEASCPAAHETLADVELSLPTADVRPERDFGGQRFVRHLAATAAFLPWSTRGLEARDLGIGPGTSGFGQAFVVRAVDASASAATEEDAPRDEALLFSFVLAGSASLRHEGVDQGRVGAGDAFLVPPSQRYALRDASGDFERLVVSLAP
jgi:quercetin dioxygenase-like cupin family protein